MPILDMPIEKLVEYKGSSPCPDDIDKYWDDALDELNKINPNAEFIIENHPLKTVECYHLYYTGTKGARIHAKFLKPKEIKEKMPAILCFHGLSTSSYSFSDYSHFLINGYCVAAMDVRGQGGFSQDVGGVLGTTYSTPFIHGIDGDKHDLLFRDCFLDTVMLAKIIMELSYIDEKRIGVYGASQGGGFSVACAALVPEIKKCYIQYPYLSDYKRVWHMDLSKGAYEGIRYYFREFDPMHKKEDEFFMRLGYIDIQNLAKRVKAEVLMATGLQDNTCPPSTQFAMYNKLTCKKNYQIYPDFGHEGLKDSKDEMLKFYYDL